MYNNDLIEKYIYAVSKYLSYKQREDILKEIRSIINDMLEERCKDLTPTDKDVRVVLAELGTPEELGLQYNTDKSTALISGEYFIKYKLALKIILIAVAIGLTVGGVLNIGLNGGNAALGIYELGLDLITASISIIGATTIVFAILERKSVSLDEFNISFDIDNLPNPPKKEEKIPMIEPVLGIVINTLFTIVLLIAPEIIEFSFTQDGNILTIFNSEFIKSLWAVIIIIGVAGVYDDIIKLIDGKYTKKVMITSIISNIICGVGLFYIMSGNRIYSESFIDFVSSANVSVTYMNIFPYIILLFILIDTINTIYKTNKALKNK